MRHVLPKRPHRPPIPLRKIVLVKFGKAQPRARMEQRPWYAIHAIVPVPLLFGNVASLKKSIAGNTPEAEADVAVLTQKLSRSLASTSLGNFTQTKYPTRGRWTTLIPLSLRRMSYILRTPGRESRPLGPLPSRFRPRGRRSAGGGIHTFTWPPGQKPPTRRTPRAVPSGTLSR